ncbi:hypothetical protein Tcan_00247 [Toxocara canis]|uniref:Secreted protein n=1 Tax=Toxocara canis TaxID=6265 RepID=A0A0B2V4K7_TOXCA|nr:hypothetical protein Tcan_00247 [Toxocara canis]
MRDIVVYLVCVTPICTAISLQFCCSRTCCCSVCTPESCLHPDRAGEYCQCLNTTTVICSFASELFYERPHSFHLEDKPHTAGIEQQQQNVPMQISTASSMPESAEVAANERQREDPEAPRSTSFNSRAHCSNKLCCHRDICIPNLILLALSNNSKMYPCKFRLHLQCPNLLRWRRMNGNGRIRKHLDRHPLTHEHTARISCAVIAIYAFRAPLPTTTIYSLQQRYWRCPYQFSSRCAFSSR